MDPAYLYTTNSLWKEGASVNHSDHRAASTAAMDAVYPLARDRAIFPGHISDGLDPHITSELWFTSFEKKGNHIVDISGTLEKKINALAQHKSQFDDFAGVKEEVMRRAQIFAKEESFEHAESFTRLVFENNF